MARWPAKPSPGAPGELNVRRLPDVLLIKPDNWSSTQTQGSVGLVAGLWKSNRGLINALHLHGEGEHREVMTQNKWAHWVPTRENTPFTVVYANFTIWLLFLRFFFHDIWLNVDFAFTSISFQFEQHKYISLFNGKPKGVCFLQTWGNVTCKKKNLRMVGSVKYVFNFWLLPHTCNCIKYTFSHIIYLQ